jgi:hypothetical protein
MHKSRLVLCCSMMLLSALARPVAAQQACESLMALKLPDTMITAAESVAAGAFTLPPGAPPPGRPDIPKRSLTTAIARFI